jgi:hypothetical protein
MIAACQWAGPLANAAMWIGISWALAACYITFRRTGGHKGPKDYQ